MPRRACPLPQSWSPGAPPPRGLDPTCDSALGSRSGGRQVPRHSPGSHPACGATSRDSSPRVACSENRLRRRPRCFPLPLSERPRRSIWPPDRQGSLRRIQHVTTSRTKSASELDGRGCSRPRQRDRLGGFQQSRRTRPMMSEGARPQGQHSSSRIEVGSSAQPVELPVGQAERLPCHAHCRCHGVRSVRAPIPEARDRIRSRRMEKFCHPRVQRENRMRAHRGGRLRIPTAPGMLTARGSRL